MPFDAIVTRSVVRELNRLLVGGRVDKIYQPFHDEIIMNVRSLGKNHKLLLTVNPSSPRISLTNISRENPINAPLFCMVLRKYLTGGKILNITCEDFERIVTLEIESLTELGELQVKKLIIEIMGKHSNIILVNHENKILESIKHVDNEMSKVREIMPARPYILPPSHNKMSPFEISVDTLVNNIGDMPIGNYLLENIKGFSPYIIKKVCSLSNVDYNDIGNDIESSKKVDLIKNLKEVIQKIKNNDFVPYIEYRNDEPVEFYCIDFINENSKRIAEISECIDIYYQYRDNINTIKSKKSNILKVVNTNISRCKKKKKLQEKMLNEVKDKEKIKLYGELLIANIYRIPQGLDKITLQNFYSENYEDVDIPLNPNITPQENAQRYFKKYQKAKSTEEMQTKELNKSNEELNYLEGVLHTINECDSEEDIDDIKQELVDGGYITQTYSKYKKRNNKSVSEPRKYTTKEGFVIAVGKNNTQNDMLTLKWAKSSDIWLHAKNIPGSHVIIRKENKEIPNEVIKKAAGLAAYFSKARESTLVAVDYTYVKNIKKPRGAKPGMVIYFNNKTLYVAPSLEL